MVCLPPKPCDMHRQGRQDWLLHTLVWASSFSEAGLFNPVLQPSPAPWSPLQNLNSQSLRKACTICVIFQGICFAFNSKAMLLARMTCAKQMHVMFSTCLSLPMLAQHIYLLVSSVYFGAAKLVECWVRCWQALVPMHS